MTAKIQGQNGSGEQILKAQNHIGIQNKMKIWTKYTNEQKIIFFYILALLMELNNAG